MGNGQRFQVEGRGSGDSEKGHHDGKYVCTTGKLPLAWPALASTLGYGFKCFAKYPNGITNFFNECLPEGYIQNRTIRFDEDGVIQTHHEIVGTNGVIVNKVTLEGTFMANSP